MREKKQEVFTINFYEKNATDFTNTTQTASFNETQDYFLLKLQPTASILDFGCGSGRDAKYFHKKGYQVTAVDGSRKMCDIAQEYVGIKVKQMMFDELNDVEQYDGIWACASILHLDKVQLKDVLAKMVTALKRHGIIYSSFKYGDFSGIRNGRYFTDFTEESFRKFANGIENIELEEMWITNDVRPDRGNEKWLNVILRKTE